MDAASRLSSAAAGNSSALVDLDSLAATTPELENISGSLLALFPDLGADVTDNLASVIQVEGATCRKDVLLVLRARAGQAIMEKSVTLAVMLQAHLETCVTRANPWLLQPPLPAGGSSQLPPPAEPADNVVDMRSLRGALDSAMVGNPCIEGAPRFGLYKSAKKAADAGQILESKLILPGELPKQWQERPLPA
jgi:hypothetical protein